MDLFRRSSGSTAAVVLALAEDPGTWRSCLELCQRLDLWAGVVYPALMRLADHGLLETGWDAEPVAGRPRRHRYRLTERGVGLVEPSGRWRMARVRGVIGLDFGYWRSRSLAFSAYSLAATQGDVRPLALHEDGAAATLSREVVQDTGTVERRLRDYLREAYDADAPPRSSFFADNAETYGEAKRRQCSRIGVLREGLVGHWVLYDARQPGFAFETRDGALLALTVGRDSVQHWMQPITQDPRQLSFDPRVPPGTYTTVTWRYLGTYAVAVPAAGSHDRAVALASRWAVADVIAEP